MFTLFPSLMSLDLARSKSGDTSPLGGEGQVVRQRSGLVMWWVRIHSKGELSPSLSAESFLTAVSQLARFANYAPI